MLDQAPTYKSKKISGFVETRYATSKFFSHSSWPTKMHAKYHIMAIKSIYDFYAEKWHEIFEKKDWLYSRQFTTPSSQG